MCNSHGPTYTRNGPSAASIILTEAILRQLHGDRAFDNSSAGATLSTERRRGQRSAYQARSAAVRFTTEGTAAALLGESSVIPVSSVVKATEALCAW